MKLTTLLLLATLLVSLPTCKKADAPVNQAYTIHVGLSFLTTVPQGAKNRLIITETGTGKYLGKFEISGGSSILRTNCLLRALLLLDWITT